MYGNSASSVCDTPQALEARSRIIEALQLNRDFKKAVKQRMGQDAQRAVDTVHRAYKNILAKRAARSLRKQGCFDATLYLETRDHEEQPLPKWRVEVFGEFTSPPWSELIPCRYDQQTRCFKADVTIRVGDQFKFVVDNGRRYLVSSRYAISRDEHGNENNKYMPKEMHWSRNERKGQKSHTRTRSVYTVNKRMTGAHATQLPRRLTPKAGPSAVSEVQFRSKNRPNYVGFDDLKPASPPGRAQAVGGPNVHHPSAQDFGRNYLSAYSPARTSPQRFDILQRPEAN
jgi:hypothetical protein